MCSVLSFTFIVIPSSSSSSAMVERRFSNFLSSRFSSFFECFFFLKRLNCFMKTNGNQTDNKGKFYLPDLGLFFILSFSCAFTCFHIPVFLTSSEMLIAERGIFITLPFDKGIFKLPVFSLSGFLTCA